MEFHRTVCFNRTYQHFALSVHIRERRIGINHGLRGNGSVNHGFAQLLHIDRIAVFGTFLYAGNALAARIQALGRQFAFEGRRIGHQDFDIAFAVGSGTDIVGGSRIGIGQTAFHVNRFTHLAVEVAAVAGKVEAFLDFSQVFLGLFLYGKQLVARYRLLAALRYRTVCQTGNHVPAIVQAVGAQTYRFAAGRVCDFQAV